MTATIPAPTHSDLAWTDVGPVTALTPGEGRTYVVAGRQIAVYRLADGTVRASAAVCPHRGGPLADGQIDGSVVVCPLHMYAFSFADGRCADLEETLAVYPARVVRGEIQVQVEPSSSLASRDTK